MASDALATWYADDDGDTYGDPDVSLTACDLPADYVTNDDDCDDDSSSISPAGSEICDSADSDEDCDGDADDDDASVSAAGKTTYYRDADADGYGVSTSSVTYCDLPSGYATYSTDCDDADAARNPGEFEICDASNTDEDCDTLADDNDVSVYAPSRTTWYRDADSDGYGVSTTTSSKCDVPAGYTALSTDCDDTDVDVNPGEVEVCFDAVDDDCDGEIDCERDNDDAERQFIGETAGDSAGFAITSAGDQNNDGTDDIFIGAHKSDRGGTDAGIAYVINGGGSGDLDLSLADGTLIGEDAGDYAGWAVAGPGDVNADGRDDMAIAAPYDDEGGTDAGKVYLMRGRSNGVLDLSATYSKLVGENAYDYAGYDVDGAGDVNNDGYPDVIAGAPGRTSSAGGAYLFTTFASGITDCSAAAAILTGETASDQAGFSVDGAGDVNGDGYDDLLVGAPFDDDAATNAGAAYVILGPQTGTASLTTADAKRRGVAGSDYAGDAVQGAGDVNNDGYDDVLVGAYGYGSYGAVYLELGSVTGTVSLSSADVRIEGTSGAIGRSIAGDGDIDLDGYSDVVLGDSYNDTVATDAGYTWVMLGPISGTVSVSTSDVLIGGITSYDYAGWGLAFLGAQDGSGASDVLVGAFGDADRLGERIGDDVALCIAGHDFPSYQGTLSK